MRNLSFVKQNQQMQYKELRQYFSKNYKRLPLTLVGGCCFYNNVPKTVTMFILGIDKGIENGVPTTQAKAFKANLITLFNDLKIESNWNVTKEEWTKDIVFVG